MKRLAHLHLTVIGLYLCCLFVIGCRAHDNRRVIFLADLEHYSSFVATVDKIQFIEVPDDQNKFHEECILGIRKENGEKFSIGYSWGLEAKETDAFGHSLQIGKSYEFPKVWIEFKRSQKQ